MNRSITKPLKVRSFIAVFKKLPNSKKITNSHSDKESTTYFYSSDDMQIELEVCPRHAQSEKSIRLDSDRSLRLILGDDAEWSDSFGTENMGYASFIEIDFGLKQAKILSSIVGLPPLFLYESPQCVILTSDIYLLNSVSGASLIFDLQSILEILHIGHPIDNKTLFKNVTMVPAGSLLKINNNSSTSLERSSLPNVEPLSDWDSYIDLQTQAFNQAVDKLDLSNSFLSLTSGLDTRAILAALINRNVRLPACTMSGINMSLDARVARKLCERYRMKHEVVLFDDAFVRNLPTYSLEAARLSGGLVSLEQSHEVYFYKKVAGLGSARLSGNLGNQVGRGGTEKVSMRNIDASILNKEMLDKQVIDGSAINNAHHWYRKSYLADGRLDFDFLLQSEVPFSSVANYCIGQHFSIQQTPYASRPLIKAAKLMPVFTKNQTSFSPFRMRLKDLRHRFLGEGESRSFQIRYIKNTGGFVASCPINWGWRAKGGVALKGIFMGSLAFLDVLVASKGVDTGMVYQGLKKMHVIGLHDQTQYKAWLKSLRSFVHDVLSSDSTDGLFDKKKLSHIMLEHYSDRRNHHKSLVAALDLALAKNVFRATL